MNLKVRGFPLPHPYVYPTVIGAMIIWDTLDLPDVTLNRAWLGSDSIIFLRFKTVIDWLWALSARRKLFSLPTKIFLDEDLTGS